MKKLLIASTLTAAALMAAPLFAQSDPKPAQPAATEGCPMAGTAGNREARHAEMQARMQAMHAQMGERHGRGGQGTQGGHQH